MEGMQTVVVGAGAAGLGAAAELRRRGLPVVVLDRAPRAGESWRSRYDGLRLNSARVISGVRGAPIPWAAGRFPSRDAYAGYLASCVDRLGLDVRFGVHAERIDRHEDGFVVRSSDGDLPAAAVVVATGCDRVPCVPDWPGRASFTGRLLHASDYHACAPFAGRDVLVVGTGNSGTEIAAQLAGAEAARVRVAMRTPVNIFPRSFMGIPTSVLGALGRRQPAALADAMGHAIQQLSFGDLSRHGMPRAPFGVGTELRRKGLGPVVDGGFVDALRTGRIELVAAVERFAGGEVVLADASRLRPDVVIAATGYRHDLEELVGHLGVLDAAGRPLHVDGTAAPGVPGLYFNGFWLPLPGQLAAMRMTSKRIGAQIARDARRRAPARASRLRAVENRVYRLIRHRAASEAATAAPVAADLSSLASSDYCLLISYRRDGTAVPTPVWFAVKGDALVFESDSDAAKISRIRRQPGVRVAPCSVRGRPQGPPAEGVARILSGAEADAAERALAEKYGVSRRVTQRLRPAAPGHAYVEVRPVAGSSAGARSSSPDRSCRASRCPHPARSRSGPRGFPVSG
jgi:PPOX class probable F420-dependent enzyme